MEIQPPRLRYEVFLDCITGLIDNMDQTGTRLGGHEVLPDYALRFRRRYTGYTAEAANRILLRPAFTADCSEFLVAWLVVDAVETSNTAGLTLLNEVIGFCSCVFLLEWLTNHARKLNNPDAAEWCDQQLHKQKLHTRMKPCRVRSGQ